MFALSAHLCTFVTFFDLRMELYLVLWKEGITETTYTRDQKDWDISNMPDNTGPKCSEWRRNCEQLTGLLIPMQKFKFMLKFIYWLLSWNKSNEMASYNGRILTKITSLYSELDCKVLCINYENVFPITRKLILYLSHLFLLTVWLCWQ